MAKIIRAILAILDSKHISIVENTKELCFKNDIFRILNGKMHF